MISISCGKSVISLWVSVCWPKARVTFRDEWEWQIRTCIERCSLIHLQNKIFVVRKCIKKVIFLNLAIHFSIIVRKRCISNLKKCIDRTWWVELLVSSHTIKVRASTTLRRQRSVFETRTHERQKLKTVYHCSSSIGFVWTNSLF